VLAGEDGDRYGGIGAGEGDDDKQLSTLTVILKHLPICLNNNEPY